MITRAFFIVLVLWTPQVLSEDRISKKKCKEYSNGVKCIPGNIGDPDSPYDEVASTVDFPHLALVLDKTAEGKYKVKCDGALISPRFVLTTANCFDEQQGAMVVRLGDHITDLSAFDGVNQIEVPVKTGHKHPDYKGPDQHHDIGLLELARDADISEYVRPACLWPENDFPTDEATAISGSVYTYYKVPDTFEDAKVLQKFNVKIPTNKECRETYYQGVGDPQICSVNRAVRNDTMRCLKSFGAPLQLRTVDQPCVPQVVGIASYGTLICANQAAVYARVSKYLDWIEKIVWS